MSLVFALIALGSGILVQFVVRYLQTSPLLSRLGRQAGRIANRSGSHWSKLPWLTPTADARRWAYLADSPATWQQQWVGQRLLTTLIAIAAVVLVLMSPSLALAQAAATLAAGLTLSWWWPIYRLRTQASRYQASLRKQLPALLERYLLGASAGLSVRQSLRLAAERTSGPLGKVTGRIVQRLEVGVDLEEAVRTELARVEAGPVRLVLTALVRSERLGMPIAAVAEEQSRFVRQLSALEVERAVDSLPLKLTICGIFFLFPPVFVVALVPNLLSFLTGNW